MKKHRSAAQAMAAECLCFRVRRVSRALTRMYDEALQPLGLQSTQLTLLNAITMADTGGGAAMGRLADILALDPTTLSRNLRPLEKAGLVRVARSPSDRRVRLVLLTPAGQRRVEDAFPLWQQAHERVVAALGSDAAAELRDRFDATVAATTAHLASRGAV